MSQNVFLLFRMLPKAHGQASHLTQAAMQELHRDTNTLRSTSCQSNKKIWEKVVPYKTTVVKYKLKCNKDGVPVVFLKLASQVSTR